MGNRTGVTEADGASQVWTYDPRQWLVGETAAAYGTSWDCLSVDDWNGMTVDDWDELPLDGCPSMGDTYTYDATGNRIILSDAEDGLTTYTYDGANRLLTAVDAQGTTTYTYDANGKRLTAEDPLGDITSYTWDFENRLIEVEHPSGEIVTSIYDCDFHRVAQDDGTEVQQYVYDGNNLLQQRDDIGDVQADYTYVPQEYALFVSQHWDAESQFYQTSGIQDVTQLTDASEVVTDEYRSNAWGKPQATSGSTENVHTFKGVVGYVTAPQLSSEESSYYSSERILTQLGQYLSDDRINDDPNPRRYVRNNPVNLVDPSGTEPSPISEAELLYAEVVRTRVSELGLKPLTLREALRDGLLEGKEIKRLDLSLAEIKQILGGEFQKILSASNAQRAVEEFPNLTPFQAYARRLAQINYNRARLALSVRNTDLRGAVDELYQLLRMQNPLHFMVDKGSVVLTGQEPVLGYEQTPSAAAGEITLYLAFMFGVGAAQRWLKGVSFGTSTPDVVEFKFPDGRTVSVRSLKPGEKYSAEELDAIKTAIETGGTNAPVPRSRSGALQATAETGQLVEAVPARGFHGTSGITVEEVIANGLPDGGTNINLAEHVGGASVVFHADGILFNAVLARLTFSRMSSAFLVQMNVLGSAL